MRAAELARSHHTEAPTLRVHAQVDEARAQARRRAGAPLWRRRDRHVEIGAQLVAQLPREAARVLRAAERQRHKSRGSAPSATAGARVGGREDDVRE